MIVDIDLDFGAMDAINSFFGGFDGWDNWDCDCNCNCGGRDVACNVSTTNNNQQQQQPSAKIVHF